MSHSKKTPEKIIHHYYKLNQKEMHIKSKSFLSKEDLNMIKYRNEHTIIKANKIYWDEGYKM